MSTRLRAWVAYRRHSARATYLHRGPVAWPAYRLWDALNRHANPLETR